MVTALRSFHTIAGVSKRWYILRMPDLVFDIAGKEITCGMAKVDRTKLYGYVDTEVLDENDEICELATLAGMARR
jgi:hypothetical protein